MKYLFSSLLAASLMITAATAFGSVKEGQYSLSPVIGGYTFDGRQHIKNNLLYGIRGGYNLTRNVGAEALFDYSNSKRTTNSSNVDMFRYGGELLYHFMPDNAFVPYVAAGVAGLTLAAQDQNRRPRWAFDYGVGLKYFMTDAFALRGDVRHVMYNNYNSHNYNNIEYTVGAHIPFGGKTKQAKAIEAPATAESSKASASQASSQTPAQKSSGSPLPASSKGAPSADATAKSAVGSSSTRDESASASASSPCSPVAVNVLFDFDKSDIKPEFHDRLKSAADFLTKNPRSGALLEGHTDSIGTKAYNMKLSLRRAESVRKYLTSKFGIEAGRLEIKGYGKEKPVADNKTKAGRAQNRRVDSQLDCR